MTLLSQARPLDSVPTVDEGRTRLIFDFRSDLWLQPQQDKVEPVRIMNTELRVPLFKNNEWIVSVAAENDLISFGRGDLVVGPQQVSLGASLRTQALGLSLSHENADRSSVSVFSNYRSDSDETFRDLRDRWVEVSILYFSPPQDGARWIFMSNQSKNRGYFNDRWLPYFGREIEVSPNLSYAVGFPFLRILWKKANRLVGSVFLIPTGLKLEASQEINEKLRAVSHAGLSIRSYLHTRRVDNDHRVFFEEKYIDTGFNYQITDETNVGMSIGASFDRVLYEAENVYQADSSRIRLTPDFYGRFILEFAL